MLQFKKLEIFIILTYIILTAGIYCMKILIYEPNDRIRGSTLKLLLRNGYTTKAVAQKKDIIGYFFTGEYNILLMDFTADEPDLHKVIMQIKKKHPGAVIFLHSRNTDKKKLINVVKAGVSGIIFKPFIEGKFWNYFSTLIKKNSLTNEKRKHIRVVPDPRENALALIRHPHTARVINSRIVNISFGGLAIIPGDPSLFKVYKVNNTIPGIHFTFSDIKFRADAVVKAATEKLMGIVVVGLSMEMENTLAEYIYKKISFRDSIFKNEQKAENRQVPLKAKTGETSASSPSSGHQPSVSGFTLDHDGNIIR